jgi:hypothetical protein
MIGWKVWHRDKMADQGLLNTHRQLSNERERERKRETEVTERLYRVSNFTVANKMLIGFIIQR